MQAVVFVVLGAIWLVGWFIVRRRVMRAMVEQRVAIRNGIAALGVLWALVPLVALVWQPELLPVAIAVSLLVFVLYVGTTLLIVRLMGRGPFI